MDLFENPEHKLTDFEKRVMIPQLLNIFRHTNESNRITGRKICQQFVDGGYPLSQQRLCLWISYVRQLNLTAPYVLIGSQKGYCVTKDPELILNQIESFEGRINAMRGVIDSLKAQRINILKNIQVYAGYGNW